MNSTMPNFSVKHILRHDFNSNWEDENPVLSDGEIAVVIIPSADEVQLPVVMFKIGDGKKHFKELPWCSSLSADVYDWAKSAEKPEYQADEVKGLDTYVSSYLTITEF